MAERVDVDGIKAYILEGGVSSLLTAHPSTEQATGWEPWDEVASAGLPWPGWSIPGKALIGSYLNKPSRQSNTLS